MLDLKRSRLCLGVYYVPTSGQVAESSRVCVSRIRVDLPASHTAQVVQAQPVNTTTRHSHFYPPYQVLRQRLSKILTKFDIKSQILFWAAVAAFFSFLFTKYSQTAKIKPNKFFGGRQNEN